MIRVYSPTGANILMRNAVALGGHVDCLGPDSTGGCYAVLGAADGSMVPFIQSLGLTALPNNLSAQVPSTAPIPTATTSAPSTPSVSAPTTSATPTTSTTPSTVNDLLTTIYTNTSQPLWNPNF